MSTYHLEDIDSDDDDSLLREEYEKKRSKSPTPIPTSSPVVPLPGSTSPTPCSESAEVSNGTNGSQPPPKVGAGGSPMPSKEELLMMMEKVDRDIAAAETQISVLEKKRVSFYKYRVSLGSEIRPTRISKGSFYGFLKLY